MKNGWKDRIHVRDFEVAELQLFLDYFYRPPQGFLPSLCVDASKLAPEAELRAKMLQEIQSNSLLPLSQSLRLTVWVDQKPIGIHLIKLNRRKEVCRVSCSFLGCRE